MADLLLVTLRAIHVLGAVFWAGGSFVLAIFHEYVIDPGDPERTIERMAAYDRMSTIVGASGIIAVLAGAALYWIVSSGLDPAWITSTYGLAITMGAIAALSAIVVAIPFIGLTNERAKDLYADYQSTGELTDSQRQTVEDLYDRLQFGERIAATLLAIAVIAMGTAQYL